MEDRDAPPGRGALPDLDGKDGAVRYRAVALEAESKCAAGAGRTRKVSKLREDTNRQFAELRADNAQQCADEAERDTRILKRLAELRLSAAMCSRILKRGIGMRISSLILAVLIGGPAASNGAPRRSRPPPPQAR